MTTFFIIVICLMAILLVGWMIKSQHARDVELVNEAFAKRVRGREGEGEEKNESDAPEPKNGVRRPLILYDSIDDVLDDEEQTDDDIDYEYLRALKEERDAYDDFIASMDMDND
jgi:hypothetical protein